MDVDLVWRDIGRRLPLAPEYKPLEELDAEPVVDEVFRAQSCVLLLRCGWGLGPSASMRSVRAEGVVRRLFVLDWLWALPLLLDLECL